MLSSCDYFWEDSTRILMTVVRTMASLGRDFWRFFGGDFCRVIRSWNTWRD